MEVIKPNNLLKFHENQLENVRKVLGYEDVNRLKQDIEQFEDWINKQNHFKVKDFGRDYIERLLIYNKGSVERAKKTFDKLLTCTNLMPEYLQNFDIKNEFYPLFNIMESCMLPTPSPDNYRVVIFTSTPDDDEKYNILLFYRYLIVMSHYLLTHDYCQGFEVVGDLRKINIGVVKKLNPLVISKGLMLVTIFLVEFGYSIGVEYCNMLILFNMCEVDLDKDECLGQRMKKIHLLSSFKLFEMVLNIFKLGFSPKLRERIMVHPTVESLYDYIPREILPKDLGGDEKTTKELAEINFKELSTDENIARVKFMSEAGTDESCRMSCTFNEEYSGVPGSFKTLCVD